MSNSSNADFAGQFEIDPPIEFQNRTYTSFTLREPTIGEVIVGDQQMRNGATMESIHMRECTIMARISGLPLPVMQKLRISTHNEAWAFVNAFLLRGQATSES